MYQKKKIRILFLKKLSYVTGFSILRAVEMIKNIHTTMLFKYVGKRWLCTCRVEAARPAARREVRPARACYFPLTSSSFKEPPAVPLADC